MEQRDELLTATEVPQADPHVAHDALVLRAIKERREMGSEGW
jgi:hypothetical protein